MPLIAKSAIDRYFDRVLYSTAWIKKESAGALRRLLANLPVRYRPKTEYWLHQMACFYLGATHSFLCFLLDMGLGKTKIALDIISYRKQRYGDLKWLVLVPRIVNQGGWEDDIKVHSDLTYTLVPKCSIEEKRQRLFNSTTDITLIDFQGLTLALTERKGQKARRYGVGDLITGYHSPSMKHFERCEVLRAAKGSNSITVVIANEEFTWRRNEVKVSEFEPKKKKKDHNKLAVDRELIAKLARRYDGIIIDEIHKLANHESLWFRLVRALCERIKYRYGFTGTPFGRDPEMLWDEMFLIDLGETLGETFGLFQAAFYDEKFKKGAYTREYTFRVSEWRTLHKWLQNRSIRYSEDECLDLPPMIPRPMPLKPSEEQRKHYNDLVVNGDIGIGAGRSKQETAKWIRLRQICAGYLVWDDARYGMRRTASFSENPKLEALLSVLEDMPEGAKLTIFNIYHETGDLICSALTQWKVKHVRLYGLTKDPIAVKNQFRDDPKCVCCVANIDSGGTGLNMQFARWMFVYEGPSDPIAFKQMYKRMHRGGQTETTYLYLPYIENSVDSKIQKSVHDGQDLYKAVVDGRVSTSDFGMI